MRNLSKSFLRQLKESWVTIFIEGLIAVALFGAGLHFTLKELEQKNTPIFKYSYNKITGSLDIDSGNDFSLFESMWWIPTASSTMAGIQKSSLPIEDIVKSIMYEHISDHVFPDPFDKKVNGYIRCVLLYQFGLNSTSTVVGYPIGVESAYISRGEMQLKKNYDLVLLRSFDLEPIQMIVLPVSHSEMDRYLEVSAQKLLEIMRSTPYDAKAEYTNDDETCRQTTQIYRKRPYKTEIKKL